MNQSEFEAKTCNRRQARENACERGTIGLGFAFHWLRTWREFCQPIIERGTTVKENQRKVKLLWARESYKHVRKKNYIKIQWKPASLAKMTLAKKYKM